MPFGARMDYYVAFREQSVLHVMNILFKKESYIPQQQPTINDGEANKSVKDELIQQCLKGDVSNEDALQKAISLLKVDDEKGDSTAALKIGLLMTKLSRPYIIGRNSLIKDILSWFEKAATGESRAHENRAQAHYQMAMLMVEEKIDLSQAPIHLEQAYYLGHPTAYDTLIELGKTHTSIFYQELTISRQDTIFRIKQKKHEQQRQKVEELLQQKREQQIRQQLQMEERYAKQQKERADNLTINEKEAIQFATAQEFIDQDLHGKAIPILEPMANNNHAGAHFLLGQMHQSGMGVKEINFNQALTHFEFAYYNGYEAAGFFLVDYHLSQTSSFKLAKTILCDMVDNHCKYDKQVNSSKVKALLNIKPTVTNHAADWYDIMPFYLKAALKMAKINYLSLASSDKDLLDLTEKIMLAGDKETQFELIEWHLTRTDLLQKAISRTTDETDAQSKSDKSLAQQMLATVCNNNQINIPDAYPKTQELMKSLDS